MLPSLSPTQAFPSLCLRSFSVSLAPRDWQFHGRMDPALPGLFRVSLGSFCTWQQLLPNEKDIDPESQAPGVSLAVAVGTLLWNTELWLLQPPPSVHPAHGSQTLAVLAPPSVLQKGLPCSQTEAVAKGI